MDGLTLPSASEGPSCEQRGPRCFGPFEVTGVHGRGGSGVIYRARHTETGEEVAVKTLRRLDPASLEALRREAHALARIRQTGIVRILEQGVLDGLPWYAMEFIDGPPLSELWARARGLPMDAEPFRDALAILRRLCVPLAFLHGEGLVHRDLKPSNVIVRSSGEPVLVDFGLVARFGGVISREALEVGGAVLGTLDYMAPEQVRGEYVDARTDLYALGCMLYELVTGRAPFVGGAWDVLQRRLRETPPPPSSLGAYVPEQLEALVLRLLAKNPRDRLGYVSDVAVVLDELLSPADHGVVVVSRPYLYRPTFTGRDAHLAQIDEGVQGAVEGRGAFLLLAGESGAGKTRLLMEGTRRALARGLTVVTGECAAVVGAPSVTAAHGAPLQPLRPFLRAVADHCRRHGREACERIVGPRGPVLAEYEPGFATLPGVSAYGVPAAVPAQAARSRLLVALGETVQVFAHEHPVLLAIDDLQWIDELSLAFLQSLQPSFFRETPLLVVATHRTEESPPELGVLTATPHVHTLEVGRMASKEVGAIVSDMLALTDPPSSLVSFLSQVSEGNPFFVSEYLRAAVEAGLIGRDRAGAWYATVRGSSSETYDRLPLPHTIRELVGRRLVDLAVGPQRFLEASSVVGREFDLELAAAVSQLSDTDRLEAVATLLSRFVLEAGEGGRLRFVHDKLREAAYGQLTPAARLVLHRRAAEALERTGADDPDLWATLAHHWTHGENPEKAIDYLELVGVHALRVGAHVEAHQWLTSAIDVDAAAGHRAGVLRRARWERLLGEACVGTGDLDASVGHASRATATLGYRTPTSAVGWVGVLGSQVLRQGWHSLRPGRQPHRFESPSHQRLIEAADAAGQVATTYYFRFDLVRGVANSLRCINLAERAGCPERAALSYAQLGYVCGGFHLHRVARRYFRLAHTTRDQGRDATAFGASLYFHAMYEMGLGHWTESERLGDEALAVLERVGNRQEAEIARTVVANTLYFEGRFREAEERCDALLESARQRANVQHLAWGSFLKGRSLLGLGRSNEALGFLEQGYGPLREVHDFVSLVMCEGLLAKALLATGQTQRAVEVADALLERTRRRGIVLLAQCLDGYAALAEVYLTVWEREGTHASAILKESARRATTVLGRFARIFRIAKPAAMRCRAWERWLSDRAKRAEVLWTSAIAAAVALRMPYEEAAGHDALARALRSPDDRQRHAGIAWRLYRELGCSPPIRRWEREPS